MSLLLIHLPPGPPGSYTYATSTDGQTLAATGSAAPALLPPAGRGVEVVAVVPAGQLSWHRVELPRGVGPGSPRLRAALVGLLEDTLLDEPEQLHFALAPDAGAGGPTHVAVCHRAWLAAHLKALDAAQRPVTRIVPELHPRDGVLHIVVVGEPERAEVLLSGGDVPGGAQILPFGQGTLALLPTRNAPGPEDATTADVVAEPPVAELAEQWWGGPVTIQPPAWRLLNASRSPWDLAQLDLARTGRARAARRLATFWREFMHAPLWHPARWGLALLLVANLVGLNAWAWRTQAELKERRAQVQAMLTDTFPHVKVVVDAPAQMAREVAALRQASGAASPRDLEPMLNALAQVNAASSVPDAIDYAGGELRVKGVSVASSALTDTNQRLKPLGYRAQTETGALVLRQEIAP